MTPKEKLKTALSSLDYAISSLKRALNASPDDRDIKAALRDVEDAEYQLRKAIQLLE